VNTHFACEFFVWGDCVDRSPEPSAVDIIKRFRLTRLHNGISIKYTSQAWHSFSEQEAQFKKVHIRDTHWDYKVLHEIAGHEGEVLLHNSVEQPWYASMKWYALFSVCLMGWLYRILFILNSQKVSFDFTKIILR
jgi:hypothetical protein